MRLVSLYFCLFASLLVFSCAPQKSEQEVLKETSELISSKDYKTAEIVLKRFLANNPNASDVRMLLGVVLNSQGQYQAAEYQFVRVSGTFTPEAFESRIESLYNIKSHEPLISFYESKEIVENAPVKISDIAYALTKARINKTKTEIQKLKLKQLDNNSVSAALSAATVLFAENEDTQAYLEQLNEISQATAGYKTHWLYLEISANLNLAAGNFERAVSLFSNLLAFRPKHSNTLLSIANTYVLSENWEQADITLDTLLKQYPNQPIVNQLKALSSLQKEDLPKAKIFIEKALQGGYTTRQNYLIAAEVNFSLGNFEQTIDFLERGLQGVKGNTNYHNMLVYSRAVTNNEQTVIDELKKEKISNNAQINNIAALIAGLQSAGNAQGIENIVSEINIDADVIPAIELEYAVIKLNSSTPDSNVDMLKSSQRLMASYAAGQTNFSRDQMIVAKSVVIGDFVAKKRFIDAVNTINSWISVFPDDDTNLLFLSEVYLAAGDYSKSIEVLAETKVNAHAYILEARAHSQLGNNRLAFNSIAKGLEQFPYNLQLLRLFSSYEQQLGEAKQGFVLNLYNNNEQNIQDAILLSIYHASRKNFSAALEALLSFKGSKENSVLYWYTLAQTYLQTEQKDQALKAIDNTKSISIVTFSDLKYVLSTYEKLEDFKSQESIIRTYIPKFPGNEKLKLRLADILISQNRSKEAFSVLDESPGKSIEYFRLKAKASMNTGNIKDAGKIYNENYKNFPNTTTVIDLAQYLISIGDSRRAQKLIINFNQSDLADVNTHLFEGTVMSGEAAIIAYKKTLELSQNNLVALNNVAEELAKLGRYKEALPFAQKASRLAPDNDIVSQTLSDIEKSVNP